MTPFATLSARPISDDPRCLFASSSHHADGTAPAGACMRNVAFVLVGNTPGRRSFGVEYVPCVNQSAATTRKKRGKSSARLCRAMHAYAFPPLAVHVKASGQ